LKEELKNITGNSSAPASTNSDDGDDARKGKKFLFQLQNLTRAVESYAKSAAKIQLRCSAVSTSLATVAKSSAPTTSTTLSALANKNHTETNSSKLHSSSISSSWMLLSDEVDRCNEKLGLTERYFLLDDGLPGRPWFKHCLQAPGMDLGYAAEAFPGIQQALDQGEYTIAQEQIDLTAERIQAASNNFDAD